MRLDSCGLLLDCLQQDSLPSHQAILSAQVLCISRRVSPFRVSEIEMLPERVSAAPWSGLRVSVSGLLLTSLTILVAAALSSTGQRVLGFVRQWRDGGSEELLQGLDWRGGPTVGALSQASRALEQKSALLNRLLMPRSSDLGDGGSEVLRGEGAGAGGLWDGDGALLKINRALDSKARLMAKFQREASDGASDFEELSQMTAQGSGSMTDERPSIHAAAFDDDAGPLERKKLLLNDILDDAASDLGPEESNSYHAPETANLQDKIADIKGLAKEQNVPLPPLAPDSDVVKGARGLFSARIEGKVVNVVDGSPIVGMLNFTLSTSTCTQQPRRTSPAKLCALLCPFPAHLPGN